MTIREAYMAAAERLKSRPDVQESLTFDLSCLLEHCFGVDRFHLSDATASPSEFERFDDLCDRYCAGEPLQYLLGEWEFYGLPFAVGDGVLIPRPDTETLVETALELLRDVPAPQIADLCAGSGAIAVTLAHELPCARVYALELSEAAFPYLERNIARNLPGSAPAGAPLKSPASPDRQKVAEAPTQIIGAPESLAFHAQAARTPEGAARVLALRADVLQPSLLPELPLFDLVVSNPPYIPRDELPGLQKQVLHEPEMALDGGGDGLDFYRALPPLYLPLLRPGGHLAFEVGYGQSEAVSGLLCAAGYVEVQTRRDLAGIERVVYGQAPQ